MWRLSAVRHKARQRNIGEEFKLKRREHEKALRQARRDQQLVSKRLLQDDVEEDEGAMEATATLPLKDQDLVEVFRGVQRGGERKRHHLQSLGKALRNSEAQLMFIKFENSIHMLVGLLSGSDGCCQLEAARCLHELSNSRHPSVGLACLPATPYLITYLPGQSAKFTELCLYTLGNLCAESEAVREKLLAQGLVPALALCIQRQDLALVEAVGFTLSQLLQAKNSPEKIVPAVMAAGMTAHLLDALHPDPAFGMGAAIECAWCLHYLVSSNVDEGMLISQGAVSRCSSLLITLGGAVGTGNTEEGVELLVWPLLRCVGNLLASSTVEQCRAQLGDSRLPTALCVLAQAYLQPHPALARESLWVLTNLTVDSSTFCSALLHLGLVPVLAQLLPFSTGINTMVLHVLANVAHQGAEYCTELTHRGIMPALCATLRMADPGVVTLGLEVLSMLVASSAQVAEEFVKLKGPEALEILQYNSQGEMRTRASYILDHHLPPYSHS